jgi:hypothetical protein
MQCKHSNHPKALTKTKELSVHQALHAAGFVFEYQVHMPFRGCKLDTLTVCAFVDFMIMAHWGVILLEVDEHQHSAYMPSCDVRRDLDIYTSIALGSGHKAVILRYNPDSFRVDGTRVALSTKERQKRLLEVLSAWVMEDPAPRMQFARFFLFYDSRSESMLPTVSNQWDKAAHEISAVLPVCRSS